MGDDDPTRGARGRTGKTGGPGEAGERGRTGDVGRVGDTGKTGDTGKPGDPGKEGKAGETGEKGDPGRTGPPGDVGAKGPPSTQPGAHQKLVVEETLRQVQGRAARDLVIRAALGAFIAALIVMIPVSIVIGNELASVGDIERVAKSNCDKLVQLAVILEEDEKAEAAATQRFLAQGSTFGLTPAQLKKALADQAARDALKISKIQALGRGEECLTGRSRTTMNVTSTPTTPKTTPKDP